MQQLGKGLKRFHGLTCLQNTSLSLFCKIQCPDECQLLICGVCMAGCSRSPRRTGANLSLKQTRAQVGDVAAFLLGGVAHSGDGESVVLHMSRSFV